MRLPNLLATRLGRLTAFFFLYVTEGIPLGFAATAVATQLRRQDVGPAEIGAFVGSFYLPWAFKWAFGPFIDVFTSERLGRRRGWILGTQIMLIVTLLACTSLNLPSQLGVLTSVLLIHNSFGAMQDVAIDALAVNTLHADERGLANGVMFGGAAIGTAVPPLSGTNAEFRDVVRGPSCAAAGDRPLIAPPIASFTATPSTVPNSSRSCRTTAPSPATNTTGTPYNPATSAL